MSDDRDPNSFFHNNAYDPDADTSRWPFLTPFMIDGSDTLANQGLVIGFQHVPSQTTVYFKAFITTFNETYNSEWASEVVYGRADPIQLFKNTQRKITLAFKVPCSTESEGYENLGRVQKLVQFLYPSYSNVKSATTISQSPLVRIKVMNLLTNNSQGASPGTSGRPARRSATYNSYKSSVDASRGLLGAISNLSVNHNLENGDIGVLSKHTKGSLDAILPKMIEINLDFSAIHEKPLGWQGSRTFSEQNFPYGAPLSDRAGASEQRDQRKNYALGQFLPAQTIARTKRSSPELPSLNKTRGIVAVGGIDTTHYPKLSQDEEEEQGYTSDEAIANAEARYAGAFGNARYNRDLRRQDKGKTSDYVDSAISGHQLSDDGPPSETEPYDVAGPGVYGTG